MLLEVSCLPKDSARERGTMKNVTKKDLVEQISERTGLTQVDTKIIVECFLDAVSKALENGTNIEIRKFGRFKIKKKQARRARNPRTNQYIEVAAGYKPVFEASRELRKRINDTAGLHPTKPPATP
jgi:DNA-binding protein HU-beta/integration host factor subunit beta